jgi:hypothetical protein
LTQLEISGRLDDTKRALKSQIETDLRKVQKLNDDRAVEQIVEPARFVTPKDPTRSIYYDPVFNPYGAPPPGMPYREIEVEPVRRSVDYSAPVDTQFVENRSGLVGRGSKFVGVKSMVSQQEHVVRDVVQEEQDVESDDDFDSLSNLGIFFSNIIP